MIKDLQQKVQEERVRILMLNNQLTQRLDEKTELEKLIRKCIDDYKEELWEIKTNLRYMGKEDPEGMESQMKERIKEILQKEKQLTLLYDKLFYARSHTIHNESNFKMA